jgi:hypothetical protein
MTRRGRPSANAQWGTHTSVLAGDWLYMEAFQVALRERNFHVLDLLIGLINPDDGRRRTAHDIRPRTAAGKVRSGWPAWESGPSGGPSILRNQQAQTLDHAKVPAVPGQQRQILLDCGCRYQRVEDM